MAPPSSFLLHTVRQYSNAARHMSSGEKLRANAIILYCCLAFSAPFAGAAEMSRRTGKDGSYARMRPLTFRDCMRSSPLEDYAGLRS
ncbi:hypothetical protein CAC42_200 [Sphaceloma murrayae]|uniref:Uncharacterized protein n=1 Tax=Sphaceloma murrayae TaxID=2082308 RepID=A0A2K1QMW6_9PEZI|nr:hypothetical protein CAC42_200 [Sphaceloma murrayae]